MRNSSDGFPYVSAKICVFFVKGFFKLTHLLNDFASKPNEILTHFAPSEIQAGGIQNQGFARPESQPFSTFGSIWTLGSSGDQSESLGRLWGAKDG